MMQQEIHQFLKRYFKSNGCEILEDGKGHLVVQLTITLDKELMNRPFYWHYLEKTGGEPSPMQLTFITNKSLAPQNIAGEEIHFGSPRLHQIFQSTKNLACYIRMYEDQKSSIVQNRSLKPWLGLNIKISYQANKKRDVFKSFGLQLINGYLDEDFHARLEKVNLTKKIPDYAFTLSPLIMPKSGITRICSHVRQGIENEDQSWADEAIQKWQDDVRLLQHFYEGADDDVESYVNEKKALQEQYEPKIVISIINGGLFYLQDQAV